MRHIPRSGRGSGAFGQEEILCMQLYESIFIVRPSLSDEDTNKLIEKMKGVVAKAGATLLKSENWGKKRLAYEVKREPNGTFVYLHFRSEGGVVSELERSYRLEDSVLKFLTVRGEQVAPPTAAAPTGAPEAGEVDRGRAVDRGRVPVDRGREVDRGRVQ